MSVAVAESKSPKFFTRWEHGNIPVSRDQGKWVLHHPEGEQEFNSGRALMRAIHNGRDPHLQVERYFKAGRWSKKSTEVANVVVSYFNEKQKRAKKKEAQVQAQTQTQTPVRHPTTLDLFGIKEIKVKPELIKTPELIKPGNTKSTPEDLHSNKHGLGIDLVNRAHEVRKLLFAGFGKRIVRMGYDPEDVLQDVYKGLLARNLGKCPWDANKSSFGHYVHMVCGCIVSNYHRKYNRINSNERAGVYVWKDGGTALVDLAESDMCVDREDQGDGIEEGEMVGELFQALALTPADEDDCMDGLYSKREVSLDVLPLLVAGWKRREISQELGIREGIITKCINLIRKTAKDTWDVSPMWA